MGYNPIQVKQGGCHKHNKTNPHTSVKACERERESVREREKESEIERDCEC